MNSSRLIRRTTPPRLDGGFDGERSAEPRSPNVLQHLPKLAGRMGGVAIAKVRDT